MTSYYDSTKYPHIVHNLLSDEDCDKSGAYASLSDELYEGSMYDTDFWNKRTLNAINMPPDLKQIMVDTCIKMGKELERISESGPLYPDLLQVVRWMKGYELFPHADKEEPDGRPHPFPWRDFATLVYLNDDYVGGETHFPNKGIEYKPKKGDFITFPGTVEFLHGVRETTTGVRYTIASFHTYDESKSCLVSLL
mgnify:CR=1 FL=1